VASLPGGGLKPPSREKDDTKAHFRPALLTTRRVDKILQPPLDRPEGYLASRSISGKEGGLTQSLDVSVLVGWLLPAVRTGSFRTHLG